jgi:membrane fusion protein (multidrug efflux system)
LLAVLTAPEMKAQISEAESKVRAAGSERLQAEAQLTATKSTYERLQKAAETPGAISGNELIQAQEQMKAADELVQSKVQAITALQDALKAQTELASYLRITAPFSGVVTDRLVHPGALVGPGLDPVLLVVEEVARLRLVVAVPEQNVGAIEQGAKVEVRVAAFPQRTYTGTVARIAHSLDEHTRTMAVELDVFNRDKSLAPGMYPSVRWPVQGKKSSLVVPKTSVVTTTERTFVIRVRGARAEWVDVTKGTADGDQVEVFGDLHEGDDVVRRASDEIRPGTEIQSVKK